MWPSWNIEVCITFPLCFCCPMHVNWLESKTLLVHGSDVNRPYSKGVHAAPSEQGCQQGFSTMKTIDYLEH